MTKPFTVAQVRGSVEACVREFGRIDAYFANAGLMTKYKPLAVSGRERAPQSLTRDLYQESTEQDFVATLRVNTLGMRALSSSPSVSPGPFFAIKHASAAMAENEDGGSIICTASIAAIRADVTPLEYAASKGALVSLGKHPSRIYRCDGWRQCDPQQIDWSGPV